MIFLVSRVGICRRLLGLKKSTAGGLDGWAWNEIKALPLPWLSGLAILLELVETNGVWPQGLLDACIAMIPKAAGDSTPLGQRPLTVLPVVCRLWDSLRLGHLRDWVEGWLRQSVFSLGNGLPSVEAWFATALDIEEVLSGVGGISCMSHKQHTTTHNNTQPPPPRLYGPPRCLLLILLPFLIF